MSLPIEVNPNMLGGLGGYQISRSVRLRKSASAYFTRTLTTSGSRTRWTFSCWVKRGQLGTSQNLFGALFYLINGGQYQTNIYFNTSNQLVVDQYNSNVGQQVQLLSTSVYRDPSAWYHVVWVWDTAQATAANRCRLYVNGVEITAFSTATRPAQNLESWINSSVTTPIQSIGGLSSQAQPQTGSSPFDSLDGYMTEVHFVNDQALTPSSFGETNSTTGVWQPKKYTGTYGTNGFYLNFSDNSGATATTIGKDYSGNGNNWTPNNISVTSGSTYDSMLDTPTPYADGGNGRGNYAVLNPVSNNGYTLANGNLWASIPTISGTIKQTRGTFAVSSGKWYFEFSTGTITNAGSPLVGVVDISVANNLNLASSALAWMYYGYNGQKYNGSGSAYGSTWGSNALIGVAFDMDAGTITFYVNGVSQGTAFTNLAGKTVTPAIFHDNSFATYETATNFGQFAFIYTPPSGFKALNTQNLPAPTIAAGAQHMAATLYTGTGSSLSVANTTTNFSFQPDFVWIKSRSAATDHALYDVLRGTQARLESNTVDAEVTADNGVTAFGSNGFTVNTLAQVNTNAAAYVGWQWKANGAGVTNTAGSITSTVSANTTAGFSVVTYTGTGANATVGHGLGVAPSMVIVKKRTGATGAGSSNWMVWHRSIAASQVLYLDTTSAVSTNASAFNSTAPTSSVFSVGTNTLTNQSTGTFAAYLFSEIAGFSAFGSYTGNGSADGPFIYTGFRPRWILVKQTSTSDNNWWIFDTSRDPANVSKAILGPNVADAENSTQDFVDILSNGFKWRSSNAAFNANGNTYVYACFAENPLKYSLAR